MLLQLYKSPVLPTLDYTVHVYGTHMHFSVHVQKLESIQTFAARVITKSWRGSSQNLPYSISRLQFAIAKPGGQKKKAKGIALCYRIINGLSIIPLTLFTSHPSPHLRHNHSVPLYYPPILIPFPIILVFSISVHVVPLDLEQFLCRCCFSFSLCV